MTVQDREVVLTNEVTDLRDFYRSQGMPEVVRMLKEDYDFMTKRGKVTKHEDGIERISADGGYIDVSCGPRKKKPRKRRPPERLL